MCMIEESNELCGHWERVEWIIQASRCGLWTLGAGGMDYSGLQNFKDNLPLIQKDSLSHDGHLTLLWVMVLQELQQVLQHREPKGPDRPRLNASTQPLTPECGLGWCDSSVADVISVSGRPRLNASTQPLTPECRGQQQGHCNGIYCKGIVFQMTTIKPYTSLECRGQQSIRLLIYHFPHLPTTSHPEADSASRGLG